MRRLMNVIKMSFAVMGMVAILLSSANVTYAGTSDITTVNITGNNINMVMGETTSFSVERYIPKNFKNLKVESSNTNVTKASISKSTLTAKAVGEGSCKVRLTYKVNGKAKKTELNFKVKKPILLYDEVVFGMNYGYMPGPGEHTIVCKNRTLSNKLMAKKNISLVSVKSSNKAVASVKKNGNLFDITKGNAGTATVTAVYKVCNKEYSYKCKVKVERYYDRNLQNNSSVIMLEETSQPTEDTTFEDRTTMAEDGQCESIVIDISEEPVIEEPVIEEVVIEDIITDNSGEVICEEMID